MSQGPTIRWNRFAQVLHWLIALLIVELRVYALHKSFGITVLVLVGLRLVWRLAHRDPPPVPMPRWQHLAANAVHFLLYLLMFSMPLSGWLFNSASNFPLQWFGLFHLPALWGPDPAVKVWARDVHYYGFWTLAALVALHAAAAFKHHYIDHDETLRRMLPGLPAPNGEKP
jgi:cytochrome b561